MGLLSPLGDCDHPFPTISVPKPSDIDDLLLFTEKVALQVHVRHQALPAHIPKNENDWRSLIEAGEVVIARQQNERIAGFYVANHFALMCNSDELACMRAALNVMCNRWRLSGNRVGFGAEVVVGLEWQAMPLREEMLRTLLRTIGFRYRYLFTAVQKDDAAEMRALPCEGWHCFQEEDDTCYMMLDAAKALRLLASRLALWGHRKLRRVPDRPMCVFPAR